MDHLTAKMSCFARAYHTGNAAAPIFKDPIARRLLGDDYEAIAAHLTAGASFFLPEASGSPEERLRAVVCGTLAPSVLARSAFCEHALAAEIRLGCRQYVLIAAGYDTFPYRTSDPGLRVFELDRPELLEDKAARAAAAGLQTPAVSVPCDLSKDGWEDALLEAGFDPKVKSFAGLLGISYYLSEDEFRALLTTLSALLPGGSAVVLDYPLQETGADSALRRTLARGAGETMKAAYTPEALEALVSDCGFLVYEHADADAMDRRFFDPCGRKNPENVMHAPGGVGYILAVRKPY